MRFSKEQNGFYPEWVDYPNLPSDLVPIDDAYHAELISWQTQGYIITSDKNGYPIAQPAAPARIEDLRLAMQLSPAEARLRLASMGLLLPIMEKINQLPDDNALKIKWEYATILNRLDPILVAFCKDELQMNDLQIDELFA